MAEQTEITNVGGEGVASEVTLANLLSVTEKMARKAGIDPKDVNKKLKALSTATEDTIKVSTKHRDAQKKNTKTLNVATDALKKLSSTAGGALLSMFGSIARSGTEMTRAFINGETSMTAFASQLPLVGNQLSILTGLFDNSFQAFQNVAQSGAAFNNSLVELRNTAAGAMMPLDEFTSMVVANSEKLAAFGGTATQGAVQMVQLNKALGSNRTDLLNMGLNFQDINEALIDYQYLTRAGSRTERRQQQSTEQQAAAAAGYTKNLLTLAKLTGQDVKSQQEKIAVASMDIAMQKKLATLTEDERDKFNLLMADAQAAGPDAVRALQQQFLGMPPLTEGMALYQSQFSEAFNVFGQGLDAVYDKNVETADFEQQSLDRQLSVMQGMDAAAARLGTLLEVAAAGGEGLPATLNEIFNNSGLKIEAYLDERGRLDVAAAQAGMDAAAAAAAARADETKIMADFYSTIGQMQSAFQTSIVTPLMEAVAPALREMVTAMTGIEYDDEGNQILEDENGELIKRENKFLTAISTVSDYINDELAPGILNFINAFKTDDPMTVISDYFGRAMSGLGDLIADFFLGANTKTIMTPDGEKEVEIKREDGFLQTEIIPMFKQAGDAIVTGVKEWFGEQGLFTQALVVGATALFAIGNPISAAIIAGAGTVFGAAKNALRPPTPPATPGATVGRDPRTGRFTSLNNAPDTGGSRLGRTAAGLGRGASRLLGPLAALLSIAEIGMIATDDSLTSDEKTVGVSEAAGGGAGALAGAMAGAAIGSVVPIIGTAIGGAIGGALGYFGGKYLGGEVGEAIVGDGDEVSSTTPDVPTIDSPGAQLAMILSTEQVSSMERIAAVNLSTFNSGLQELLQIDLRSFHRFVEIDWQAAASGISTLASTNTLPLAQLAVLDLSTFATGITSLADVNTRTLSRFAAIDFTTVASGISTLASTNTITLSQLAVLDLSTFATGITSLADISTRELSKFAAIDFTTVATGLDTFAKIPDLQTNFDTINSLDAEPVRSYTEAIDGLVESLNKLNEELSQDNDTMLTSRADAGELLSGISASTSGTSQSTEQLNNTMHQVLVLLREMRDIDIGVERNTRNIVGSNLAQGNVSSVGR